MLRSRHNDRVSGDRPVALWRGGLMRAAAVACWLCVWQLAAWAVGSPLLLAGPLETLGALARLVPTAEFWAVVAGSAGSIVGGFCAAFLAGSLLGALAGMAPAVAVLLRPLADALKTVPVACVIVVLLLWVGSAGVTWAAVFLMVFPAYYFCLLEAYGQRDRALLDSLRLMGVGPARRLLCAGWPQALPFVRATSKNVVGMSWKAGVAAELIGLVGLTLGERVYQAKLLLETADLFAWTLVVVACAWAAEKAFLALLSASGRACQALAVALSPDAAPAAPGELALADARVARGETPVLAGVSLLAVPGARLCLMAPSGTGKTTALLALAGLLPLAGGASRAPGLCSLLTQETRLVDGLSARDNVRLAAPRSSWPEADALLDDLLGAEFADKPAGTLSGGQRRRVALARALAAPTGAVLLDEPFSGLDEKSHREAARCVLAWQKGRPLVAATHDAEDALLLNAEVVDL